MLKKNKTTRKQGRDRSQKWLGNLCWADWARNVIKLAGRELGVGRSRKVLVFFFSCHIFEFVTLL